MTGVNPATLPHVRVTGCAGGGSSRFSPILVLPITRFTERSAAFTERNPYCHAAQTDMSVYPAIFGPVFLAMRRPTGCRLSTHEYKIRFRESPPICESICKAGPPKDTFAALPCKYNGCLVHRLSPDGCRRDGGSEVRLCTARYGRQQSVG